MSFKDNPEGQSLISIKDLNRGDFEFVYAQTDLLWKKSKEEMEVLFPGKIMGYAFFQKSTRTRMSFVSAAKHLGAKVLGFSDPSSTSAGKGEDTKDTVITLAQYGIDALVMRHPCSGAAKHVKRSLGPMAIPVLNAGDGQHEHPTQTILDGYTTLKKQGTLDGIAYGLFGDLRYGRTIKSKIHFFRQFPPKTVFLCSAHPFLDLPSEYLKILDDIKIPYEIERDMKKVLPEIDEAYFTRIQDNLALEEDAVELKEKFGIGLSNIEKGYGVTLEILKGMRLRKNFVILHPLPRREELDRAIDETPFNGYMDQMNNGLKTRAALLHLIWKGQVE